MKTFLKLLLFIFIISLLAFANGWGKNVLTKKNYRTLKKESKLKVDPGTDKPTIVPSKVTMVKLSPPNPEPGEEFEVKVYGTPAQGDCQIFYFKGDGQPGSLLGNSKSFPYTAKGYQYKYDKAGTYTFKVQGNSTASCNCSGKAQVIVHVRPKLKASGNFPEIQNQCPPGWKKQQSNSETFTCVPKCPQDFKCPEGWSKECLDCGVRCTEDVAPPN